MVCRVFFKKTSPFGATSLAGVLARCKRLTYLNLEANDLEDAGSASLVGVLRLSPALVSLDLGNTGIEDAGAISLPRVLV
jgi:hypothetical protein